MTKPATAKDEQLIVKNRRALFDYDIEERFEAGMVLAGSEVKSMRAGKVDVVDAYVQVDRGEAWLKQLFVAPFEQASAFPHEPRRSRKLLLHGREIEVIHQALARGGYTVVPMRLYFKRGRVKVELGMGKGKKHYDKRADIAKRDAERDARVAAREGDAPVTAPHVHWAKGGEARVAAVAADAIVLRSTVPAPPGSRIEGRLEGEPPATVRVKVHASKRQPEGDFIIEGRLLDATREVRARLEATLASPPR